MQNAKLPTVSAKEDRSAVSLTAYFTGQVWCNNGLSPQQMSSFTGKALYNLQGPVGWVSNQLFDQNLESNLLLRHKQIDRIVETLIEEQGSVQIFEIASGLSTRAMRFLKAHPTKITRYVEADLPSMAKLKFQHMVELPFCDNRHKVLPINILKKETQLSPEFIFDEYFDTQKPVIVITEGLVNYFSLEVISNFWRRLAKNLNRYPSGFYVFENWPEASAYTNNVFFRGASSLLKLAGSRHVNLHFASNEGIIRGIQACGFEYATITYPNFSQAGKAQKICPFQVICAETDTMNVNQRKTTNTEARNIR